MKPDSAWICASPPSPNPAVAGHADPAPALGRHVQRAAETDEIAGIEAGSINGHRTAHAVAADAAASDAIAVVDAGFAVGPQFGIAGDADEGVATLGGDGDIAADAVAAVDLEIIIAAMAIGVGAVVADDADRGIGAGDDENRAAVAEAGGNPGGVALTTAADSRRVEIAGKLQAEALRRAVAGRGNLDVAADTGPGCRSGQGRFAAFAVGMERDVASEKGARAGAQVLRDEREPAVAGPAKPVAAQALVAGSVAVTAISVGLGMGRAGNAERRTIAADAEINVAAHAVSGVDPRDFQAGRRNHRPSRIRCRRSLASHRSSLRSAPPRRSHCRRSGQP